MGWTPTNTLWLATRGGDVYFGSDRGAVGNFDQARLGSRGFGILDIGCAPLAVAAETLNADCVRVYIIMLLGLAHALAFCSFCSEKMQQAAMQREVSYKSSRKNNSCIAYKNNRHLNRLLVPAT